MTKTPPKSPSRSKTLAINVVSNSSGWYINTFYDGVPTESYGPLDGPITLPQALVYVASLIILE